VLLAGFALAVPYAWSAAGGWSGLRAAGGAEAAAAYASPFGMGGAALLGLLVTFVPSFAVSPGLVQKTYGARSAASARRAVLWNAAALFVFAFVPPLLGMAARATRPGLANPELALPVLLADVLPAWVGSLGLVALFAAEISTADAVLFMLSTSLAQDLYRTFVDPTAPDARLLRVSRWTAVGAGTAGVAVALFVPSVADALKMFYGVMTVALFVPVLAGLLAPRVRARDARWGVVAGTITTASSLYLLGGAPTRAWLPYLLGIAASAVVCGAGPRWGRARD